MAHQTLAVVILQAAPRSHRTSRSQQAFQQIRRPQSRSPSVTEGPKYLIEPPRGLPTPAPTTTNDARIGLSNVPDAVSERSGL